MAQTYSVKLKTLVDEHHLTVVHAAENFDSILITTPDLNRPGLQMAGFYDYFDPNRIQVIGKVETNYLMTFISEDRADRLEEFMSRHPVAVVVAHSAGVLQECLDSAKANDVTLLVTDLDTSEFMAQMISTLRFHLAPRETRHGVLVEVHGEGMLITGDSGIGKSETALELIKRGHRLIADDAVVIKRTSRSSLVGTAPDLIRYYMELRGIGVIDARRIYGMGAVKASVKIDLVINLEAWDESTTYDRLGIDTHYTEILGVSVPHVTIPVRPGRNLAVILELAAMENRQRKEGFNAALNLADAHDAMLKVGL